jgi:hypothetical protein
MTNDNSSLPTSSLTPEQYRILTALDVAAALRMNPKRSRIVDPYLVLAELHIARLLTAGVFHGSELAVSVEWLARHGGLPAFTNQPEIKSSPLIRQLLLKLGKIRNTQARAAIAPTPPTVFGLSMA